MPAVPAILRSRWRSGKHIGDAKPRQVVKIQRGVMDKEYGPFRTLDGRKPKIGFIAGSQHNAQPWHGFWRATGDWIEVPNVSGFEMEGSFGNNGVGNGVLTIENVVYKAFVGLLGGYHAIKRGYMAPWVGYTAISRAKIGDGSNEWLDVLNGGYRVKVWQGYGDSLVPTFTGLIDDTQARVSPDQITITCRDFGELFTDQRLFGFNKAAEVRSPVVFADRERALAAQAKGKKIKDWILVDDAADVVKWVFMWAGFHEWEAESFGARLKDNMVFHEGDYLVDVINHVASQAGYQFFMAPPTEHEDSIGVPVFRSVRALAPPNQVKEELRDSQLLTEIEPKWSKNELPWIIRVRGKESKRGVKLGEDPDPRILARYFPPWSGAHRGLTHDRYQPNYGPGRLAGVRRHITYTDNALTTEDECLMACLLIAIQAALNAYTAIAEAPGYPGLWLDDQVSLVDGASGTNSRLWIASYSSSFTVAQEGTEWTMTLGGSMIDTPDMDLLARDYLVLLRRVGRSL